MLRTVTCGELDEQAIGRSETLAGWVYNRRDHGGIVFIDLRDRYGITQVVFNPQTLPADVFERATSLHAEDVVTVGGRVSRRPAGTENPRLETGLIELVADTCEVLSRCPGLPFEIGETGPIAENTRLAWRYLDLRRPVVQRNLLMRHEAARATREVLCNAGFIEIETPLLGRSTPEGARDYLVPSRLEPGRFYALPQSPQLYKQVLMTAGFDRYFQLVRCLRDEDLRADRQPEFTQVDIEASFVEPADIRALAEEVVCGVYSALTGKAPARPFRRLSWREAIERYGTDKPDLRFGLEIADHTELLAGTGFEVFRRVAAAGGCIRGFALPETEMSNSQLRAWEEKARQAGAAGLVWLKISGPESVSPVKKFLGEETIRRLAAAAGLEHGLLFLVADQPRRAGAVLDVLRRSLAADLDLAREAAPALAWVDAFPLFEYDGEEKRLVSVHHPFTAPATADLARLESEPERVTSQAYDLVLNGMEIAGGSIRIHQLEVQEKVFALLGIPEAVYRAEFGFLLEALRCGTPPHGGIAIGFDRLVATVLGQESIREVIAFPKTQRGGCLMTGAPGRVAGRQLRELGLRLAGGEAGEDGEKKTPAGR